MSSLRLVAILFGSICIVVSMPFFLLGMLGLAGVLADVSIAENRQFGMQFLGMGSVPFVFGILVVAFAIATKKIRH